MNENELTYQDYLDRITIQDVLQHAGYKLNRRDGLRYPSFVRLDSNGRRVHGDKFVVTRNNTMCFHPPVQKTYNVISLIKSFPSMFSEHVGSNNLDHLVNEVCRNILNIPKEDRMSVSLSSRQEVKPFDIKDYSLHRFRKLDFDSIKKFYPYFVTRGISLDTQKAFGAHFVLATKTSANEERKAYTNLSFPQTVPGKDGIVGFEERGHPRLDGSSGYKGKALGSNSSEGLWIANLGKSDLSKATHVYWFESAYDAMSYYQLHQKDHPELQGAVFVSTGGNPTVGQMRGMLFASRGAVHHACFDNDLAGRQFTENLKGEANRLMLSKVKSTPERKSYLDTIPLNQGIASGDIDLLPKPVQDKYAAYESAWEEAMSMRQSGLCYEGDIKEQEQITKNLNKEYRQSLRTFLGIENEREIRITREIPQKGKDWNEQVLKEREEAQRQEEESMDDEKKVSAGIDLDADGDIELNESEEKKHTHKISR